VYDASLYSIELDLLEIRLHELLGRRQYLYHHQSHSSFSGGDLCQDMTRGATIAQGMLINDDALIAHV
jgi:hypothetical protein